MTFQEAYAKTGRVLCITISAVSERAPPVLLNYISAPDVIIRSAVVASASAPGLLKPSRLQRKNAAGEIAFLAGEYWDGSIDQDIPKEGLLEMLNCKFLAVSQLNPHIAPFYFCADGRIAEPNRWEPSRRGGYVLSGLELFLKMDMVTKLAFLKNVGAVRGFTSNLMTQAFSGTTTIVPNITPADYLAVLTDPSLSDMRSYFRRGRVAAYRNCALLKLRYQMERALDSCVEEVRKTRGSVHEGRRSSMLHLHSHPILM